jgi:uncharacterized protein (TIGR03382 family)
MKRLLMLALVFAPTLALARVIPPQSPKEVDDRVQIQETMKGAEWYTCATGDPASLVVAAAAIGLLRRRRR